MKRAKDEEIFTATAFALIGFAVGAMTMHYILS